MGGKKLKLILICLTGSKLKGYFCPWHITENLLTIKSMRVLSLIFEVKISFGGVFWCLGLFVCFLKRIRKTYQSRTSFR